MGACVGKVVGHTQTTLFPSPPNPPPKPRKLISKSEVIGVEQAGVTQHTHLLQGGLISPKWGRGWMDGCEQLDFVIISNKCFFRWWSALASTCILGFFIPACALGCAPPTSIKEMNGNWAGYHYTTCLKVFGFFQASTRSTCERHKVGAWVQVCTHHARFHARGA